MRKCNNVSPVHQDVAAPAQGEASSNPLVGALGLDEREGRPTPNYKRLQTAKQHERQN